MTDEDTPVALAGILVSDVNSGGNVVTVALNVDAGTLNAASAGSVSVVGTGTSSLSLSGTIADISAYFASVSRPTYAPPSDFSGAVTLTASIDDDGNSGAGGVLTDADTTTITVGAVNDAPVNTLPSTYSTSEETSVGLTGISLSDIDAGSGTMTATFDVTSGTLTASDGGGVTVSGSGTAALTLSGTLADLNAYLAGASRPAYVPTADFNGPVTLTLTTDDGGNTGTGGAQADVDTSTITVGPVNDAPVNTLPSTYSTNEDTSIDLTGISLSDIDAGSGTVTATLG